MTEPLVLAEPETPFWGFGEIFISIAAFLVSLQLAAGAAARWLHADIKLGYWQVAEEFAAYLTMFVVLKVIFFWKGQSLLRSLGWVRSPFSPLTMMWLGFALVVSSVILQTLLRTPQIQTPFEQLLNSDPISKFAISFFGVTVGPVIEELLFRGLLQPVLVSAMGVFPGILLTSALFGALHLSQNAGLWQSGVLITMAGFAFGVVRHVSGSTRASSIMHIAYNALPFVATLLQGTPSQNQ